PGDFAEGGGGCRLVADCERRMVQDVLANHAEVQDVAFSDPKRLVDREVEGGVPWTVEDAAAQLADGSGCRHGEGLAGEGGRAVWCDRAAVASDSRGSEEVRTVARHAELEEVTKLVHVQIAVHRVALIGLNVA